jgi:hypothetical protein
MAMSGTRGRFSASWFRDARGGPWGEDLKIWPDHASMKVHPAASLEQHCSEVQQG